MNELEPLYDVDEMGEHWHCKRTSTFGILKKYKIKTVRVNGRTLAPLSEIKRVDTENLHDPSKKA